MSKSRRNEVRIYRRFCTAANISPWPVSDPIRALCIVAKFSGGSYGYEKLWSVLTILANLTAPVFKSAPAYLELASLKAPPSVAFKTKDVVIVGFSSGEQAFGPTLVDW